MKLNVVVYQDRTFLGGLTAGSAFACPIVAESHTGEDPRLGTYRLISGVRVPSENKLRAELGPKVLIFQSVLNARDVLVLHGGLADCRGVMMATDGALRIGYEDILTLSCLLKEKKSVLLVITVRPLDACTETTGARVSDEHVPSATLRNIVRAMPEFAKKKTPVSTSALWYWFSKHYARLGCVLCKKW